MVALMYASRASGRCTGLSSAFDARYIARMYEIKYTETIESCSNADEISDNEGGGGGGGRLGRKRLKRGSSCVNLRSFLAPNEYVP